MTNWRMQTAFNEFVFWSRLSSEKGEHEDAHKTRLYNAKHISGMSLAKLLVTRR